MQCLYTGATIGKNPVARNNRGRALVLIILSFFAP